MTVAELIKALQNMPQDLEVSTEGCDCFGDVADVELVLPPFNVDDYVLLKRSSCSYFQFDDSE